MRSPNARSPPSTSPREIRSHNSPYATLSRTSGSGEVIIKHRSSSVYASATRPSCHATHTTDADEGPAWIGLVPRLVLLNRAEDTRFELVRVLSQHAFQACALGH